MIFNVKALRSKDAQLQSGDIHNFKLNTDFTVDIATVDVKLLIENRVKGYSLDTLGREQSVGLAFTVPVDDLNFDVGIGGKNSSPFGAPNAYDTLVASGFNESDLAGRGLAKLTPALKGLPFKDGIGLFTILCLAGSLHIPWTEILDGHTILSECAEEVAPLAIYRL